MEVQEREDGDQGSREVEEQEIEVEVQERDNENRESVMEIINNNMSHQIQMRNNVTTRTRQQQIDIRQFLMIRPS